MELSRVFHLSLSTGKVEAIRIIVKFYAFCVIRFIRTESEEQNLSQEYYEFQENRQILKKAYGLSTMFSL